MNNYECDFYESAPDINICWHCENESFICALCECPYGEDEWRDLNGNK